MKNKKVNRKEKLLPWQRELLKEFRITKFKELLDKLNYQDLRGILNDKVTLNFEQTMDLVKQGYGALFRIKKIENKTKEKQK